MQETVALREERANLGSSTEVGEDALALLAVPLAASVVVMTDPGRSPSLVGRTALAQLNLKRGEVWKGKGQNVPVLKPQRSSRVGRGGPDGGPVVFLCCITWMLCLALRVHVDTLRLSFKSCREVDSYLGQLWMYCKVSDGNQLEAFILAVYMYVGLNNKSSRHTRVAAYASHLSFQSFAPCRDQNVANCNLSNGQSCRSPSVTERLHGEHADEPAPSARATVAPAVWREVWLLVRWPGLES